MRPARLPLSPFIRSHRLAIAAALTSAATSAGLIWTSERQRIRQAAGRHPGALSAPAP